MGSRKYIDPVEINIPAQPSFTPISIYGKKQGLTIGCINTHGFKIQIRNTICDYKSEYVKNLMEIMNLDVLVASETGLTSQSQLDAIKRHFGPNYAICGVWGPDTIADISAAFTGVVIFVKKDPIDETAITLLNWDINARWLSLAIDRRNQPRTYIMGVYLQTHHTASRTSTLAAITQFMKQPDINSYYKPGEKRFVLGDFNSDLLLPRNAQDKHTQQYLKRINLHPCNTDPSQATYYKDSVLPNGQINYHSKASTIDFICSTPLEQKSITDIEILRVPIVSPDHALIRLELLDESYNKRTKWKLTRNTKVRAPKQFVSESNKEWGNWLKLFTGLEPSPPSLQSHIPVLLPYSAEPQLTSHTY